MAIVQFASIGDFRILSPNEITSAFSFEVDQKQQLSQILLTTYIHGTATSEKIKCFLFSDSGLTKQVAQSENFLVSQIPGVGSNWYGQIGITFPSRPWIGLNNVFYVGLDTQDYTKSESFYLSFLLSGGYIKNTLVTFR